MVTYASSRHQDRILAAMQLATGSKIIPHKSTRSKNQIGESKVVYSTYMYTVAAAAAAAAIAIVMVKRIKRRKNRSLD